MPAGIRSRTRTGRAIRSRPNLAWAAACRLRAVASLAAASSRAFSAARACPRPWRHPSHFPWRRLRRGGGVRQGLLHRPGRASSCRADVLSSLSWSSSPDSDSRTHAACSMMPKSACPGGLILSSRWSWVSSRIAAATSSQACSSRSWALRAADRRSLYPAGHCPVGLRLRELRIGVSRCGLRFGYRSLRGPQSIGVRRRWRLVILRQRSAADQAWVAC